MWHGKKFADLNPQELMEAMDFYQLVLDEVKGHAPIQVWGFFNQKLSDLTLLQFTRPRPDSDQVVVAG